MEYWLPILFAGIMGLSLLTYVVLDGFDLGIGLLLPLVDDADKDTMVASVGPFWDANETWLVLGVGVLLVSFPYAHGQVLSYLYIPVTAMLIGLIIRGIAFDFRVKARDKLKSRWNRAFFVGSLLATLCQGWMLGIFVTGLDYNPLSLLFALLITLSLPALYVMLGGAWLLIKTEGQLYNKALHWLRRALPGMGLALLLVSIATPLVSSEIAAKWFSFPNIMLLAPIPLITAALFAGLAWLLFHRQDLIAKREWLIFVGLVLICIFATLGLAYSILPDIIIGRMSVWEAAAAPNSLLFVFVGVVLTLPIIIGYTIFVYRVFRGKSTHLSYE